MRISKFTAVLAGLVLVVAACGDSDTGSAEDGTTTTSSATSAPNSTTATPDGEAALVSVYFFQGEQLLVGEARETSGEDVVGDSLSALMAGTSDFEAEVGLTSAIPDGVQLFAVDIDDRIARVDVSASFGSGGGSQSMQARIAQVVYTATQFDHIEEVRFLLDGEEVDAIGGEGVLVEEPLGRDDFELGGAFADASLVPPVLLESPRLGEEIDSPLRLTGSAEVSGATFEVEIVDGDGLIVAEETVTATPGAGDRGSFDATVEFAPESPGLGAIVTSVHSAGDGSREHVREIPVRL